MAYRCGNIGFKQRQSCFFYLDGNLVKEYSLGRKYTELKTVTFQTQTDEGYGSITSNFAADNIVIYVGGYMGASTVTADSADIIVDNSSNTISVPEGTTGSRLKSALAAVSEKLRYFGKQ
ncbi:MAG: hypothetical protein L6V93_03365 [Clostridiales bacterium]|nr:MAG: hypothetical protein L6V93_03365 [Clostridiales bacterium]